MRTADAARIVRSAIDNRPKGFVAVSVDLDVLETLVAELAPPSLNFVAGDVFADRAGRTVEVISIGVTRIRYRNIESERAGSSSRASFARMFKAGRS